MKKSYAGILKSYPSPRKNTLCNSPLLLIGTNNFIEIRFIGRNGAILMLLENIISVDRYLFLSISVDSDGYSDDDTKMMSFDENSISTE